MKSLEMGEGDPKTPEKEITKIWKEKEYIVYNDLDDLLKRLNLIGTNDPDYQWDKKYPVEYGVPIYEHGRYASKVDGCPDYISFNTRENWEKEEIVFFLSSKAEFMGDSPPTVVINSQIYYPVIIDKHWT